MNIKLIIKQFKNRQNTFKFIYIDYNILTSCADKEMGIKFKIII